jgi:hypothetical protein
MQLHKTVYKPPQTVYASIDAVYRLQAAITADPAGDPILWTACINRASRASRAGYSCLLGPVQP